MSVVYKLDFRNPPKLRDLKDMVIRGVLMSNDGNVSVTAEKLGINRRSIQRHMKPKRRVKAKRPRRARPRRKK